MPETAVGGLLGIRMKLLKASLGIPVVSLQFTMQMHVILMLALCSIHQSNRTFILPVSYLGWGSSRFLSKGLNFMGFFAMMVRLVSG